MNPNNPWFWIFISVCSAVLLYLIRLACLSLVASFRTWVMEPVAEAKERASVAAEHTEALTDAIGPRNGHGNLMEMGATILANQEEHRRWQVTHSAEDTATHELLFTTRDEMALLRVDLGALTDRVYQLEQKDVTRLPFDDAAGA